MTPCPCGSKKDYKLCCGRFIENSEIPATAEELMRSRYTAYSQANIDYIVRTMKGKAAENFDAAKARGWATNMEWLKLIVVSTATEADKAFVEFRAYLSLQSRMHILHERSEFHFENGQWYYVSGEVFS